MRPPFKIFSLILTILILGAAFLSLPKTALADRSDEAYGWFKQQNIGGPNSFVYFTRDAHSSAFIQVDFERIFFWRAVDGEASEVLAFACNGTCPASGVVTIPFPNDGYAYCTNFFATKGGYHQILDASICSAPTIPGQILTDNYLTWASDPPIWKALSPQQDVYYSYTPIPFSVNVNVVANNPPTPIFSGIAAYDRYIFADGRYLGGTSAGPLFGPYPQNYGAPSNIPDDIMVVYGNNGYNGGALSGWANYTSGVDRTPPVVSCSVSGSGTTINVSMSAVDDISGVLAGDLEVSVDGGGWVPASGQVGGTYTATGVPGHNYHYIYRALNNSIDQAGNHSSWSAYVDCGSYTPPFPPVTVSGRITNAITGAPIPGVLVNQAYNPCGGIGQAFTDANGIYSYSVPYGTVFCLRPPALPGWTGPVTTSGKHAGYPYYECQVAGQYIPNTCSDDWDLAVDNIFNFTYTPLPTIDGVFWEDTNGNSHWDGATETTFVRQSAAVPCGGDVINVAMSYSGPTSGSEGPTNCISGSLPYYLTPAITQPGAYTITGFSADPNWLVTGICIWNATTTDCTPTANPTVMNVAFGVNYHVWFAVRSKPPSPWIQTSKGDVGSRADSNLFAPAGKINGDYLSVATGANLFASAKNWLVAGYGNFKPSSPYGYGELFNKFGGGACNLAGNTVPDANGVYIKNGDLVTAGPPSGGTPCGASSKNATVVFVTGNLTITGNFNDPPARPVVFIVAGSVTIGSGVTRIGAAILSDGDFLDGTGDNQLVITGAVMSALNGSSRLSFQRDFLDDRNKTTPVEVINLDPAYYYLLTDLIGESKSFTEEVNP